MVEPHLPQWRKAALASKTGKAQLDSDDDDIDLKKQIKYGTSCEAASAMFSEYCDESSIHGVKYIGAPKRPFVERLFWLLIFVCSIYACVVLITDVWDKWNNNPVIVSFAEKSTPVWQIPFPTVTICSETKTRPSLFNYTDIYWRANDLKSNESLEALTDKEIYHLLTVSQVCDAHLAEGIAYNESEINGRDMMNTLTELMPDFNDTYWACKWHNKVKDCNKLFQKYLTDDGICYSFNALNPSEVYRAEGLMPEFLSQTEYPTANDWNLEDGYEIYADDEIYPNRVLAPGPSAGLFMVLNGNKKEFDNLCRGPVQGFKIILSTPGEVAQSTKQYFRIPFDQEVLISIKPKIITTSEGLKHYEPYRRQCYFQNERYLRYFHTYTQSNCELECLANFTLGTCGCVKFSMPRSTDEPICITSQMDCLKEAEDELFLNNFEENQILNTDTTACNCLPSCTSISYEAEISQADFDYKALTSAFRMDGIEDSKVSRVGIYFKEAQFLTSRRSELYGTTDFLANCGGLLGLFMGVSTFSFIEFIYFCTVRLVMNLIMRYRKRKTNTTKYP